MMENVPKDRPNPAWYRLQIRARQFFNRIPLQDQQKIYILTLLIGGICGLAAVLFHVLLDYQDQLIYRAASSPHWWGMPHVVLLPAAGGLMAGAGLYFYAPEAAAFPK